MNPVAAAIRGAARITAFCHQNPDADTVGAAIAIRLVAERLRIPAEVVCADPMPRYLGFLPGVHLVRTRPALAADVAVILDAGDLTRIGDAAGEGGQWLEQATVVNIDHHISNPGFGTVQLVDPTAASTCELVAELLPELGVALDPELATALLAGIVNDTHTFSHPNATARTLRVAAALVEAGALLADIHRAIYADKPFATLAVWGRMLAGVAQEVGGRIVHAALTQEMLQAAGAELSDTEGFVDLLGITRDADVVLLFKEVDSAETRVSIRTSARADAVAIAAPFGGGGHPRAAGCTLQASLAQARIEVLAEGGRELARADARRH